MLIFFLFLFCAADLFSLGCIASPSKAVGYENEDEFFYDRFGTCNFLFKDEDGYHSSVEVLVLKDQSHSVVASEDEEKANHHDYHDYEDDEKILEEEKESNLTLNAPVSKANFSSKNAFSNIYIEDENSTSSDDNDDDNNDKVIYDAVQTKPQIIKTSKVSSADHSSDDEMITPSAPNDHQINNPENLKIKKSKSAKNNKKRQARRKILQAKKEFTPLPIQFLTNTAHTTRESPQGSILIEVNDSASTEFLFFGKSAFACLRAISMPEQLRRYKSFHREIYSPQDIATILSLLDVSISSTSSDNAGARIVSLFGGANRNKSKLQCEAANCSCKRLIIAPSLSPFHISNDPTNLSTLAAFDEEDFRRGIFLITKMLPTILEDYSLKVMSSEMNDVFLNIWEYAKETLIKINDHSLFAFNLFCKHPKLFEDIEECPLEYLTCKNNLFSLTSFLLKTPIDCDKQCCNALIFLNNSANFCANDNAVVDGIVNDNAVVDGIVNDKTVVDGIVNDKTVHDITDHSSTAHDNSVKVIDFINNGTMVRLTMKDIRPWWLAVQAMAHLLEEDPYMAGVFNQQVFRSLSPFVLKLHSLYAANNHCLLDVVKDSLHHFYQRTLIGYNDLIRIARFMAIFSEIPPCRIDFYADVVKDVAIAATGSGRSSRLHKIRSKRSGKRNGDKNSSKANNQRIAVFRAYHLAKEYVCPFDIFSSQSCSTFLSMLEGDFDCVDCVDYAHDVNGDDIISANAGTFAPYQKFNYKHFKSWEALNWDQLTGAVNH